MIFQVLCLLKKIGMLYVPRKKKGVGVGGGRKEVRGLTFYILEYLFSNSDFNFFFFNFNSNVDQTILMLYQLAIIAGVTSDHCFHFRSYVKSEAVLKIMEYINLPFPQLAFFLQFVPL